MAIKRKDVPVGLGTCNIDKRTFYLFDFIGNNKILELKTRKNTKNKYLRSQFKKVPYCNENLQNLSLRNNAIAYLDIAPFYEIAKNKNIKNVVFDDHNLEQIVAQHTKNLSLQEKTKDLPTVNS